MMFIMKMTSVSDVIRQNMYHDYELHAFALEECYCGHHIDFEHNWPPRNSCSLRHTTRRQHTARGKVMFKVPNIVHYTWFMSVVDKPFQFHHMLSVLSVDKYLKPDAIYFHTNQPPTGEYWNRSLQVRNFHVIHRTPSDTVWDVPIRKPLYETSASNVERLKILSEHGGIYMDLDYVALRSFDPLRVWPCTVGTEYPGRVCGGLVLCAKDSPFLYMWLKSYIDDYQPVWAYNTGIVPIHLAKKCPHLVHIEHTTLHHPNYLTDELGQLLRKSTWWKRKNSYGVHLWYRKWKGYLRGRDLNMTSPDQNLTSIRNLDNPYGEIARTILFGSPHVISSITPDPALTHRQSTL